MQPEQYYPDVYSQSTPRNRTAVSDCKNRVNRQSATSGKINWRAGILQAKAPKKAAKAVSVALADGRAKTGGEKIIAPPWWPMTFLALLMRAIFMDVAAEF